MLRLCYPPNKFSPLFVNKTVIYRYKKHKCHLKADPAVDFYSNF